MTRLHLPRRAALLGAASLLGAAASATSGGGNADPAPQKHPATPASTQAPGPAAPVSVPVPKTAGLNTVAMQGGRFFGTAIDSTILVKDAPYMDHVVHECGILTGETAFKWGAIRPDPDVYDFSEADRLMRFAERHAMMARGHTLLWHEANPDWLKDRINPGNAEQLLLAHIQTVVGHCRNRVVQWDVVNEMVERKDGRPLALRDSIWTRALGPNCIDIAFHACAEADPLPLRFINEYGLDYDWESDENKRQDLLALLARMKSRGVPVQGLGMQAHLDASVTALNQTKLALFCDQVAAMGLKIVITELDVRDNKLPADTAVRDAAVASHTKAYLDAVLSCPAVMGVLTWGLSDRRSWLNDELPREDKLIQRALPLDVQMRRKPMWQAIADAFAAAPPRG
jgi:endo-1,4-beta-xylanase